jgi:hypothetical protein
MASSIVEYLLDGGNVLGIEYAARVYASCLQALQAIDDPRRESLRILAREQLESDEHGGVASLPWHAELRDLLGSE